MYIRLIKLTWGNYNEPSCKYNDSDNGNGNVED